MRCTLLLITVAALVAWCAGRPEAAVSVMSADDKGMPPVAKVEHLVIEVSPGETAVLQCPSNDEHHRFQFWWMKPDQIIGPGTALNSDKFKYEVLTGTLYIKVPYIVHVAKKKIFVPPRYMSFFTLEITWV